MNTRNRRPVGPIIDHPAMQNYEFLMDLNDALGNPPFHHTAVVMEMIIRGRNSVPSELQDQFLSHEPQLTLQPEQRDPLETGAAAVEVETPASQPYVDYFENTSLSDSELLTNAGSHRRCRAQEARRHHHVASFLPSNPAELDLMIAEEREEREAVRALHERLDKLHDAREEVKAKLKSFEEQFFAAAEAWSTKDNTTFKEWEKHILNAHKCSTSKTRVWHIASWFKGPTVPQNIYDLVEEVGNCYTQISYVNNEWEIREAELGNEDAIQFDSMEDLLNDDEGWVSGHEDVIPSARQGEEIMWFGEDFAHSNVVNGFSDYVPKGSGKKMAKHVLANLKARQVRLTYAYKQEVAAVKEAVLDFAKKAEQVTADEKVKLSAQEHTNPNFEADIKAVSKAHQTIVDYRVQMTKKRKHSSDDLAPASSWDKEY